MDTIKIKREGDFLIVGEQPQLVIGLKTQNHYIKAKGKKIPYKREIFFSKDLLEGKRKQVFETAIRYYYEHATSIARGILIAEEFREKANLTTRDRRLDYDQNFPPVRLEHRL